MNPETIARAFQQRMGHVFSNLHLLEEALTHSSVAQGRKGATTNERLEFLGDRVLGLIVCTELYRRHPAMSEAELARALNALVRTEACAEAARAAELGPMLRLAPSEAESGGREKDAILADACEALIAALYLDGGMSAAQAFVLRFWGEEAFNNPRGEKDSKTALQEWAAAQKYAPPTYSIVARSGPDHAPRFEVEVAAGAHQAARGEGGSKREAEQQAARAFLNRHAS